MAADIAQQLIKIARSLSVQFVLNGRPMTMEEVFAYNALLPGFAKRADQLCSLCLGYGIGATFDEEEGATLGVKVIFDDLTPQALRLLCMVDVLYEICKGTPKGEPVSLDQLMYD